MTGRMFPAVAVLVVLLAGAAAAGVAPGRWDVIGGAALGTAVAGLFAGAALYVFGRIRASGGENMGQRLVNGFVGLMLARMIGYLTFLGGVVLLGVGDAMSVCLGLVAGTVIFQFVEIIYLRKTA